MPTEYDEATLHRIQACEMDILHDFVRVCETENLTWFGFAGTGIGALRHKGFIPWDDDIDLGLPRKDYDRLIEVFSRDYADKYTIVRATDYDDYPLMTTRICLNGSVFMEESLKNCRCPLGIFLDIYPFDNAADDPRERRKQAYKCWFLSKLLILRHVPFPVLPFRGVKARLIHAACACVWFLMNVFHISHRFLCRRILAHSCRYNDRETNAVAFFCGSKPFNNVFEKEDLLPLRMVPFEDVSMPFPRNVEKSLTRLYGDFMTLPPVEKRKNHYPYRLVFPDENEK